MITVSFLDREESMQKNENGFEPRPLALEQYLFTKKPLEIAHLDMVKIWNNMDKNCKFG